MTYTFTMKLNQCSIKVTADNESDAYCKALNEAKDYIEVLSCDCDDEYDELLKDLEDERNDR